MADIKSHATLTTSLVSYWDLQEVSGTRYDLHGSNHLTDTNTVTSTTGKVGTAALFTSANSEYLTITDASQTGLDINTTGSWSYWIYFVTDTDAVVIDKTAAGVNSYWMQHQGGTGTTQVFSNSAETSLTVTATMNTGTWYHVVWTYNAGTVELFLNGSSQGTASGGSSLTNTTAPFTLGRVNKYTSNYLNGYMDEVGVWSKVLSGSEITDLYNSGNGLPYYLPADVKNSTSLATSLVSYWMLDEASGNRADSHGSNTLADNATVTSATGIINNGASFDDATFEYLNITDASQTGLDFTGSFSFSCWVKPKQTPNGSTNPDMAMMYKWGASQAAYGFYYASIGGTPKLRFNGYTTGGGGNISFDFTQTLSLVAMTHVVMVYTSASTKVEVYVNGVSLGNVVDATYTGSSNTTGAFSLSSLGSGTQWYWDGVLDEAAIWGKSLTAAEVRALYGYGTPPNYEDVAVNTFTPRVSFIM